MPEPVLGPDLANLVLDRGEQVYAMTMAGLLAPGGAVGPDGSVDIDPLRTVLMDRVATIPRLGQRIAFRHGRPRWVTCLPDPAAHIRILPAGADLGAPGAEPAERLAAIGARLAAVHLPLDRPLWEVLVVPALTATRAGLFIRVHHAAADGLEMARIVRALLDPLPGADPLPARAAPPRRPTVPPSTRGRLAQLREAAAETRRIMGRRIAPTALLGPLASPRTVILGGAALPELRRAASRHRATPHDVFLAALAGALSDLFTRLGEPTPVTLPVSVPVAVRGPRGAGNRVGAMILPLPLQEPDRARRLATIHRLTVEEKWRARARGLFPPMATAAGAILLSGLFRRQHAVGALASTVPGPRNLRTLAGARLETVWPVPIISMNARLSIGAVSYADCWSWALTADAHLGPYAAALGDAIGRELAVYLDPDTVGG